MANINITEHIVDRDIPRYPVTATKISFFNQGKYPVSVGYVKVMPGDVYQVNYEHPHLIVRDFSLLFDLTAPAAPADILALGLQNGAYLVIQTMTPA